ncbi:MAG: FG-GAP-like repeat-containing protein [Candidatus Bathyarchaeota archaeon]|nr:FG-GAP-like repeat-containing protein [Candidatus Bathyarchaeota archaeon]
MQRKTVFFSLTLILLLVLITVSAYTFDQTGTLTLKAEQHWETYGTGGTCIHGSHNLFLADVDGDGAVEIVTGGLMYQVHEGKRLTLEAPLKIWNWSSQNLTLEKSHKWAGNIECVYTDDVDNDGTVEIVTAGSLINGTSFSSALRIWSYNGKELTLKASHEGTYNGAIFASDLDRDGAQEIITVGRNSLANWSSTQLAAWQLHGDTLTMQGEPQRFEANVTSASTVYAYDLDADGETEIITAGYSGKLENSSGQLRVWHWNGTQFLLKADAEWRLVENGYGLTIAGGIQGNTVVNNVKVGDVDGDGSAEIVTGGFAYDGENVAAQLRIWTWNGTALLLEASHEWTSDYLTEVKCISLRDVDCDLEIVTSGIVAAYGSFNTSQTRPNHAQLRVWRWDGKTLSLKQSQEWTIGDGVCAWNVGAADLDDDEKVEIVTVGCMGMNNLCDPDLRIWAITVANPIEVIVTLAATAVITAVAAAYFLADKIRNKKL